MIKLNQNGAVSGLVISFVLTVLLLCGAIGFGAWAFMSRQDYKDNVDAKISEAVQTARQEESKKKEAEFVEREKQPLETYSGPEAYGSVSLQYPKTWSGYVNESSTSSTKIDGFFAPGVVPSISDKSSSFALRMQVVAQAYDQVVKSLDTGKEGAPTVEPYALPGLPDIVGVKVSGNLTKETTGEMVVLPLRSETLKLWTEGSEFTGDFNNIILKNFTFSP